MRIGATPTLRLGSSRAQRRCSVAVLSVALVLTALSLSHLAGTRLVTGCAPEPAWAMAIGIDLAFVSLEIAMLYAADRTRWEVARFAMIAGTLAVSGAMNALSFSEHAEGLILWPAIGLGTAIPALVYALTRVGAGLWRAV